MEKLSFDLRWQGGLFSLEGRGQTAAKTTAIVGKSGSGKSTLIKLLAGLLRPTRGEIRLGDQVLVDTAKGIFVPPWQRRFGVVFQEARLWPHQTVGDQIRFGGRYREEAVIEGCGIEGLLERSPRTLSGGEAQRVAVARALMSQPRWLLLDEPLAAVDQSARAKVLRMLGRLRDELGVPMLYVTHDIGEALELTDSFFLMADGTLSGPGELYKLAQEPGQFEHVDAIGIETILRATVLSDDASQAVCRAQMGPYAVTAPRNHARVGETIRLGVRPRDVLLAKERVDGLSARNVFDGRVVALRECDGHQLAEIDVGQPIVAEVTLDALSALGLEVGSSVTVYIKSTALRFRGVDGS